MTYQTFARTFYIITNTSDSENTITDVESGIILNKIPANSQGLIFAIGRAIETTSEVKINILK